MADDLDEYPGVRAHPLVAARTIEITVDDGEPQGPNLFRGGAVRVRGQLEGPHRLVDLDPLPIALVGAQHTQREQARRVALQRARASGMLERTHTALKRSSRGIGFRVVVERPCKRDTLSEDDAYARQGKPQRDPRETLRETAARALHRATARGVFVTRHYREATPAIDCFRDTIR